MILYVDGNDGQFPYFDVALQQHNYFKVKLHVNICTGDKTFQSLPPCNVTSIYLLSVGYVTLPLSEH